MNKEINAYLMNHKDIVDYKEIFTKQEEFRGYLQYISNRQISDFDEFENIYLRKNCLLNRLDVEKSNPKEVVNGICGMKTALANIKDMEKIINDISDFYELCCKESIEPQQQFKILN